MKEDFRGPKVPQQQTYTSPEVGNGGTIDAINQRRFESYNRDRGFNIYDAEEKPGLKPKTPAPQVAPVIRQVPEVTPAPFAPKREAPARDLEMQTPRLLPKKSSEEKHVFPADRVRENAMALGKKLLRSWRDDDTTPVHKEGTASGLLESILDYLKKRRG